MEGNRKSLRGPGVEEESMEEKVTKARWATFMEMWGEEDRGSSLFSANHASKIQRKQTSPKNEACEPGVDGTMTGR